MYSWATEVARVWWKRDQTSLQNHKHSFHKRQCWTSFSNLSEICSTYRATSTQHSENFFIFRLLKTWRWLVRALRPRSWHNFANISVRQKLLAVAEPSFENRPGSRILCLVPALRHAEKRKRGTLAPRSPFTQLLFQGSATCLRTFRLRAQTCPDPRHELSRGQLSRGLFFSLRSRRTIRKQRDCS